MIFLLTCECGGVENLARKPLRRAGLSNWADIQIWKGSEAKSIAKDLAERNPDVAMAQSLNAHLAQNSRFAVIVGTKNGRMAWSDVARNDSASLIEAQVLVESFA